MDVTLSFKLSTQQVLHMYVTEPDGQVKQLVPQVVPLSQPATELAPYALEQLTAQARAEMENRIYHMGAKPTPNIGYDDRLPSRLKCCQATTYKYLGLPVHRGGIRHRRVGKKYHVTERAIREWEGDSIKGG